jgi:transcriptional regulator with XRE-family HTH domain
MGSEAFDMKVNADLVIELRKTNSWSQEELAIAAGINLRTVQRIESQGSASLQSKKALASVFDIDIRDLDYQEKPIIMKYEYKVLKIDVKKGIIQSRKLDSLNMEAQLNQYGAEGWELVHISEILETNGNTAMLVATMRRPLHQS